MSNSGEPLLSGVFFCHFLEQRESFQWMLLLCGGYHCPNTWSRFFMKSILYICLLGYFLFCTSLLVFSQNITTCLIALSGAVHVAITIPIITHAIKRMNMNMLPVQEDFLDDVLCRCQNFVSISILVTILGATMLAMYAIIDANASHDNWYLIMYYALVMIFASSISLLSTWGVLFIVLDVKTIQYELTELTVKANNKVLACETYLNTYKRVKATTSDSLGLCDAISLVCYFNILACVFVIMFGEKYVLYDLGVALLFLREAIILAFCIPSIVHANECHEMLGQVLAEIEGGMEEQVKFSQLWILAKEWPLHILVLSRKMVSTELRYQIISLLLMFLLAITSFMFRLIVT